MASFEKYTDAAVSYELRHNTREHPKPPKNAEIDPERSSLNYYLSPKEHGRNARESKLYYNQRLKEVYHHNRADVKTACQWIITEPADLSEERREEFFLEAYEYLNSLYGEENCIHCIVHQDEGVKNAEGEIVAGRSHLHYMFIPVVENLYYLKKTKAGNISKANKFEKKVCADKLINRQHLTEFHPNFQKWMDEAGIKCTVHSGVTGGKNKTVAELKAATKETLALKGKISKLEKENQELKSQLEIAQSEQSFSWGSESAWEGGSPWKSGVDL